MRHWLFILILCLTVMVNSRGTAQTNYQPEHLPAYQNTDLPDLATHSQSHLLKKALPIILNPVADTCIDLQELEVKWTYCGAALCYRLSLDDMNTNKSVIKEQTVYEPLLRLAADYFKYGHRYRLRITAGDSSESATWSYITFKINILPTLSGLALAMALHENVVWENCLPELITARDRLKNELKNLGWTIYFTSAYRPYQLQEHYYLILQNLKDPALAKEDISYLQQEKKRHGLGVLVAKPSAAAPHIRGAACDAMVLDNKGQPMNGLRFIHPRLLALMQQAGFKAPPAEDYVHFEVDVPDNQQ